MTAQLPAVRFVPVMEQLGTSQSLTLKAPKSQLSLGGDRPVQDTRHGRRNGNAPGLLL